jgi:hypothetical protein
LGEGLNGGGEAGGEMGGLRQKTRNSKLFPPLLFSQQSRNLLLE